MENLPLVDSQNILLPSLHIKLGLIKNLFKPWESAIHMGAHFSTKSFRA